MGMSPNNVFVGLNSILDNKINMKRPKSKGIPFLPAHMQCTWDNVAKELHADWNGIDYGLINVSSINIGIWGLKPQPIWKKVHWTGLTAFKLFKNVNITDGYSIMSEWETQFGILPPGPWFMPVAERIYFNLVNGNGLITHVYKQLVTATN